ncbi:MULTISPECIES: hypothetical protein [Vibrio]|uniref:hypothetical protein n=1 Tax=Vibrio TaxID=662 RepID=UPI0010561F21|nr:hypothetical protein [Vibrio cyclitrophicus]
MNTLISIKLKGAAVPYCQTTLVITPEINPKEVINQLSRTKFKARAVQCEWNANQFAIDNGMNNVRAEICWGNEQILFCCRYSQYVNVIENIVIEFADDKGLSVGNWST